MSGVYDRQREREPLPKKDQINAISDIEALEGLKEEIERRIIRIETDLDFHDGTSDWEARARGALSIHRYTEKLIGKRINVLKHQMGRANEKFTIEKPRRKRERCHDLTWMALDGELDELDGETPERIAEHVETLSGALDAIRADELDERARSPVDQDPAFLAEASASTRKIKKKRHELTIKAAAIRREAKEADRLKNEAKRERMFIDECRRFLPRETYSLIWDRVDRLALEAIQTTSFSPPDGP